MKSTRRPTTRLPLVRLLLLAAAALACPAAARAQWATSGDHINSTNAGNVGVGTGAPAAKLDVVGPASGAGPAIRAGGGGDFLIAPGGSIFFDGNYSYASGSFIRPTAANTQSFFTAGAERLRISPAGNVGLGTPSPASRLHIAGDNTLAGGYPVIRLQNTNASGRSWWLYSGAGGEHGAFGLYDETAAAYRMFFNPSGSVGFGTTSPGAARLVAVTGGSGAPADSGAGTLTSLMGAAAAGGGTAARGVYGYANVWSVSSASATGVKGLGEALNLYEGQAAYGASFTGRAGHAYGYTRSAYGLYAKGEMTGASVGSVYGGYFEAAGGSTNATTNYAVYASATGNGANFGVYSAAGTNYFADRVGIGTAAPGAAYKLDVQGGRINASGGLCIAGDCKVSWAEVAGGSGGTQWTTSGTSIHYGSGNVGVGTSAPAHRLDVAGHVRSSSGGFVFPDGTVQTTASAGTVTGVTAGSGLTGGGANGPLTINVGAGAGLTAAADSISVNYGSAAGTAVEGNRTLGVTAGAGLTGGGQVTLGAGGSLTLTNDDRGSAQSIFKNVADAAGATQFSAASNNDAIRFEGTGGTTVTFNAAAKKVTINSSAAAAGWTDAGASLTVTNASANVGIGTASPSRSLEVVKPVAGNFDGLFVYNSSGAPHNSSDSVSLSLGRSSGHVMGRVTASNTQNGTFGDGYLAFSTRGAEVVAERMRIDEQGRVGIGKANPTEALDVVGNIRATGSVSATYQDVAEWVPSTQRLAAGTVVVLDTGRTNHVLASSAAYDTKVAGVVSERPGLILGEGGEGRVMVATTGRVRVRVDATAGPIRVGDLLVTSGVEGAAMKSEPITISGRKLHAPGTIIGKALEPLEKGTGEILVLLSLQ